MDEDRTRQLGCRAFHKLCSSYLLQTRLCSSVFVVCQWIGVQKLLSSIEQLRARVEGKDQDIEFLSELLASSQLQSLIKVTPISANEHIIFIHLGLLF